MDREQPAISPAPGQPAASPAPGHRAVTWHGYATGAGRQLSGGPPAPAARSKHPATANGNNTVAADVTDGDGTGGDRGVTSPAVNRRQWPSTNVTAVAITTADVMVGDPVVGAGMFKVDQKCLPIPVHTEAEYPDRPTSTFH